MDLYDITFFSKGDKSIEVEFEEDKNASCYPLTISINSKQSDKTPVRVIKIFLESFIDIFHFVQSVNESYEKLLAAKEE